MKAILITLAVFLISLTAPSPSHAQGGAEIGQQAVLKLSYFKDEIVPGVSTAIPFRTSNDTLYVLATCHSIQPLCGSGKQEKEYLLEIQHWSWGKESVKVGFQYRLDKDIDIAVLATTTPVPSMSYIGLFNIPSLRFSLRMSRWRYLFFRESLSIGSKVFALGCGSGFCWHDPEEGQIVGITEKHIMLSLPTLRGGLSGGPVVYRTGSILGILSVSGPGSASSEARLVRWDYVVSLLRLAGFPPNLYTREHYYVGQFSHNLSINPVPLPPQNRSGRLLPPGWDLSVEYRLSKLLSVGVGVGLDARSIRPNPNLIRFNEASEVWGSLVSGKEYFYVSFHLSGIPLFYHLDNRGIDLGLNLMWGRNGGFYTSYGRTIIVTESPEGITFQEDFFLANFNSYSIYFKILLSKKWSLSTEVGSSGWSDDFFRDVELAASYSSLFVSVGLSYEDFIPFISRLLGSRF
jgi:hypothetical protein